MGVLILVISNQLADQVAVCGMQPLLITHDMNNAHHKLACAKHANDQSCGVTCVWIHLYQLWGFKVILGNTLLL